MKTPANTSELPEENQTAQSEKPFFWYVTYLPNGKQGEKISKGSVPVADCPTQEDIEQDIEDNRRCLYGLYKLERKQIGQFNSKETYHYRKSEPAILKPALQQTPIIAIGNEDSDKPNFEQSNSRMEDLLSHLIQKVGDLEDRELERQETPQSGQSDAVLLIKEMQRQNEKNLDRYIGLLENVMKSQQQPKENPTEMMLSMLKGTLEVQRGVRDLSEEIAPDNSSGGSLLADGAKLVNAIGNSAGSLLPMLGGVLGGNRQMSPLQTVRPATPTTNGNTQSGELAALANKVKTKKDGKK